MGGYIIAVTNQKGGVGKTTTTINLAQALSLGGNKVLVVDTDPSANATQGFGIDLNNIGKSVGDLILDRNLPVEEVIYKGDGIDLIPSSNRLSAVQSQMAGITNCEFRLGHRIHTLREAYDVILIDTPPTFGELMNSALNAADFLIVPVDCGYFGLVGIKELLSEVEEIRQGSNPRLEILGFLMTLADQTRIAGETCDELVANFGDKVFTTKIRRNVRLKEAPALGKTIFHHDSKCAGAEDYLSLGEEVIARLVMDSTQQSSASEISAIAAGGAQ